jgi:endonuclease/exonuclease/phosphatase family metal-dependent hydrolase
MTTSTNDSNRNCNKSQCLSIVSFNVAGCEQSKRAPSSWSVEDSLIAIEQEIVRKSPDIIALQEVPPFALDRRSIFPNYQIIGSQSSHAPYVVLLVRKEIPAKRIHLDGHIPAVVAELQMSMSGKIEEDSYGVGRDRLITLWVASVHLEPFQSGAERRRQQLQSLANKARLAHIPALFIAGDTNMRVSEDKVAENEKNGGLQLKDFWKLAGSNIETKYTVSLIDGPMERR